MNVDAPSSRTEDSWHAQGNLTDDSIRPLITGIYEELRSRTWKTPRVRYRLAQTWQFAGTLAVATTTSQYWLYCRAPVSIFSGRTYNHDRIFAQFRATIGTILIFGHYSVRLIHTFRAKCLSAKY